FVFLSCSSWSSLLLCRLAWWAVRGWALLPLVFLLFESAPSEIYTLSLHDALPISVVLPAHLAGGRQLVRRCRPGDGVVARDDDVVPAGEECCAHLGEWLVPTLLGQQFVDLRLRGACGGELDAQDVLDVLAAVFLAEVVGHVLRRGRVHAVAVVQRPVVVGEDLVEVRHAAEERLAVLQLAGDDAAVDADLAVDVPDHAGFFRGS